MSNHLESKIYSREALVEQCLEWKNQGLKIVFTNGCFDILHEGHVRYLAEARGLGNKLVLGLNSDASVSRLKGPSRPINPQGSRAIVLAGLSAVDAVCVFEEDTPYEMIESLLPDILVKGGDWKTEQIVGSNLVLDHGGQVFSLSFHEGYSTTRIEQKIKAESK